MKKIIFTASIFLLSFFLFLNFSILVLHAAVGPQIPKDPLFASDLELTEINPTSDMVSTGEVRNIEFQIENKGPGVANNFVFSGSVYPSDGGKLIDISTGSCTSTNTNDIITKVSNSEFNLSNIAVGSKIKCVLSASFNQSVSTDYRFSRNFTIYQNFDPTGAEKSYDDITLNNTLTITKFVQKGSFDLSYTFDPNPITVVKGIGKEVKVKIENLDSGFIPHIFSNAELSLNLHPFPGVTVQQTGCIPLTNANIHNLPCYNGSAFVPMSNIIELTLFINTDNSVPTTFEISNLFKKINFTDPNSLNDSKLVVNTIAPKTGSVDLSVTLVDTTDKYIAGLPGNVNGLFVQTPNNYVITITNNSDNDVVGAYLKTPIPLDKYKIFSLSPFTNIGMVICGVIRWAYVPENILCPYPENEYQVNFNLAAHDTLSLQMGIYYSIKDIGPITIPVTVEVPAGVRDTDLSNNIAEDTNTFEKKVDEGTTLQYDLGVTVSTDQPDRLLKDGDIFEDTVLLKNSLGYFVPSLTTTIPEGVELTGITCQTYHDINISPLPSTSFCNLSSIYFEINSNIYPIKSGTRVSFAPVVLGQSISEIPITFKYKVNSNFKSNTTFDYNLSSDESGLAFDYDHTNNQATVLHKVLPPCASLGDIQDHCDFDGDGIVNSTDDDIDGDFVSNTVEKGFGDANADGIQDYIQSNVLVLTKENSTQKDILVLDEAAKCAFQSGGQGISLELDATTQDKDYDYPLNLVKFKLKCTGPVSVTAYFGNPNSTSVSGMKFRKYGPSGWYDMPATISEATLNSLKYVKVVYTLQDGQLGDSTGVDGMIVDPAGLGVKVLATTGGNMILFYLGMMMSITSVLFVSKIKFVNLTNRK